ncbi:MAG: DnaA regulatory inactivator Hda [Dokdonella sp.]|nr:MAG: DnaA regulatory inactivator Hda [Dokdonella sp.]
MSNQLPLALRWPAHQRFQTFLVEGSGPLLDLLQDPAAGDPIFICGPHASGKTHLLIATCAHASAAGQVAQYLDLARFAEGSEDGIRALGGSDLLALDNVDSIAGNSASEHALFDLYNRCRAEGTRLLFAAQDTPGSLGLTLPDLVSRLASSTQWSLRPLDEAGRRTVLRERAAQRGIALEDEVMDWLFNRHSRDLATLTSLLDRIDRAALAAKRRVTVPFLRQLLDG